MQELVDLITSYGITLGIILWTMLGLIQVIKRLAPEAWGLLKERERDRREHEQLMETKKMLMNQSERAFWEGQVVTMTSDMGAQLGESNEFIRREVSSKLDLIYDQVFLIKELLEKEK